MDRLSERMWGRTRTMGKRRFVLILGPLHSVCACLLFLWVLKVFSIHPSTWVTSVIAIALLVWGPFWAHFFWDQMERMRNSGHADRAPSIERAVPRD